MTFYYRLPAVDLETAESLYQRYFRYLGKHGRVTNIYLSDWVIYFDVTILKCDLYHIITKSIIIKDYNLKDLIMNIILRFSYSSYIDIVTPREIVSMFSLTITKINDFGVVVSNYNENNSVYFVVKPRKINMYGAIVKSYKIGLEFDRIEPDK